MGKDVIESQADTTIKNKARFSRNEKNLDQISLFGRARSLMVKEVAEQPTR